MSAREIIALGTASQAPTRYRAHNAFVLRWDDQLVLFDPGEGTQRQAILAGVAIARLDAICITHFHGDHSLGLAGVIQRRALDARSADPGQTSRADQTSRAGMGGPRPLPVYFPADGGVYFERLRTATIFHDTSGVEAAPITVSGLTEVGRVGGLILSAAALDHRVTTFGYRLEEPEGITMLPEALAERGIEGPDVGRLIKDGRLETEGGTVELAEVSEPRPGQAVAFIMDTAPCQGVIELARGADLVVMESTYLHSEVDLAAQYRHLTARQAAELAVEAGVRRLVLGHFSARYQDHDGFRAEAGAIHPDVVVVEDLDRVPVPRR